MLPVLTGSTGYKLSLNLMDNFINKITPIDCKVIFPMLRLDCQVQQYAWGKNGSDSAVAKFKSGSEPSFLINEGEQYAELWMGTHPSGPSTIHQNNEKQLLKDWLLENPSTIGRVPSGYDGKDLPFLFKVLSINTALSIQSHPDKVLAQKLHEKFPNIYKDGNHKPEMAIALTEFTGLCGFRRPREILEYLSTYPELSKIIGDVVASEFKMNSISDVDEIQREAYRKLFQAFMSTSDEITNECVNQLVTRLTSSSETSEIDKVIITLNKDYPNDRGIFCPLLLNYLKLSPGESFFMGPNEPHAYLSGNCVECMALSDNVVRAGLTPKFKDVDTLVNMLHYRNGVPSLITPKTLDENTTIYRPPIDLCAEFEVEKVEISANMLYSLRKIDTASIILIVEASDNAQFSSENSIIQVSMGSVLFIGANAQVKIDSSDKPILLYRAHVNLGNE